MRRGLILALAIGLVCLAPPPLPADNLTVGKDYYELRRFTDALAALKLAVQENPQNWEAFYYTGLIYQESGKPDLALKFFTSAWRAKPGIEKVGKLLNDAYLTIAAKGRAADGAEGAVRELENAIKMGFFSVDLVNQLMTVYAEQARWDDVLKLGEEVFRRQEEFTLFPRDGSGTKRTHLLVGRAYYETRVWEKALEHIEIATVGRENGAQELWAKVQSTLAAEAKPFLDRGEELYRNGQMREARASFEKALRLHKDNAFARKMVLKIDNVVKAQDLEGQAHQALGQGDAAEALDLLRQAAMLYPENTRLMEQIRDIQSQAAALEASKQAREAVQAKARRDKQDKFAALVQKAHELEEAEKFTEAQGAYQEALALYPDDANLKSSLEKLTDRVETDGHYRNAVTLFGQKKWADAIKEFRLVDDKAEAGFRQSRRFLALAYLRLSKADEFERYAALSLERSPEDLELLYLLADQSAGPNESRSRLKDALARFRQIEKLNPAYRDAKERAGKLYWQIYWPEYLVGVLLVLGYGVVYIFIKQRPRLMKRLFLKDLDRLGAGSDWNGLVALFPSLRQFELDNKEALQAHMAFTRAFYEARQYGRSITEGQLALRLAPRNKEVRVLLGRAFYANKTISPEVLEYYLDLLEVEPDNRTLLGYVGNFCTEKKILNPTTMALLRQLAQVQPENDKVRTLLVRGYLKDNDRTAAAMALYRIEVERNPQNLDVRSILAEEHLRRGDVQKAIAECEEILNVTLNHSRTHDLMIEAYTKLGKIPELVKTYQSILENEPHNTFIQSRLARLMGTTTTGTILPVPSEVAAKPPMDEGPAAEAPNGRSSTRHKAATPVRGTQKCPKCGGDVPVGAYFCSCGCPL